MRIISTANAGVIIRTQAGAIGIDALHDKKTTYFSSVSEDTFERISQMNLDVLLYTHDHPDHYSEEMTARYTQSKNVPVFAPFECDNMLAGDCGEFDVGFAHVEYKRLLHDGEQFADVVNLGYIVTTDGKRVLIPGDAGVAAPGLLEFARDIDVLLCNFPYVAITPGREIVNKIDAKHIIVYHLPYEGEDNAGFIKSAQRARRNIHFDAMFTLPLQSVEV